MRPDSVASRRVRSIDVIDVLSDLFILPGMREHTYANNRPEFADKAKQECMAPPRKDRLYLPRAADGGTGREL
jgi:hypothetical protein